MAAQLYKTSSGRLFHAGAVAVITVGLPARGKTHSSRSLCRYMRWMGVATKVFSVGNYRRERFGSMPEDWFDDSNVEAARIREQISDECLDDMIAWLTDGGQLAIYDGNNIKESRRRELNDKLLAHDIHPLFIEFVCNKPDIVLDNIKHVKISSPDYVGWNPEDAVVDYGNRIKQHEAKYETIADTTLPFVKLINAGEQLIVNNCVGYLQSRIVYFLMNLHINRRTIYFARTGLAIDERSYKIDADLSDEGKKYAAKLRDFVVAYREKKITESGVSEDQDRPLVWTSTRKKAKQTAYPFMEAGFPVRGHSVLTQMNPGEADGLTNEELKEKFPEEVVKARENPYRHRYPRGEVRICFCHG
ncbi:6-phosphofructo-2-kinase-domain-containing protein [Radiomyces spectabilis]|uniref:6-phosphofructo-2-kinase-domain-containing protein n=1 Tax=Radiomyces spectabilis TaxID=64574 RepID=UPI00222004AD|nr:6-phosphofructo-2-kinase-domain-containing protein [Radiomyces spectabilis]KAI8374690.1 6-phosphofructo-2-kinase-domain-containing protein [Radiomyces spectabilis]